MKANELRIGNLVEYFERVTPINVVHLKYLLESSENFKPIPLTEEWLLKFGIYFTSEKEWYQLTFTIKGLLFETASSMEGFTYNLCFDDMINIKYIHQLQNLYFALTNEELTIK